MNAKFEELLNKALSESERRELGSLLELEPGSLTRSQHARLMDLFQGLMQAGWQEIQWTWHDFEHLTSSGHIPLLSGEGCR